MANTTITLDSSAFERALRLFMEGSKRSAAVVLQQQAKLFVADVVSITPPAHAKKDRFGFIDEKNPMITGAAAKKHGENVIRGDISRIIKPMPLRQLARLGEEWEGDFGHTGAKKIGIIKRKVIRDAGELARWHRSRRNWRGRVPNINKLATTGIRKRDLRYLDIAFVPPSLYKEHVKKQIAKVGLLASGWCAAAARLGLRLPAWITRHGTGRGGVRVSLSGWNLRITVANNVPFGDRVAGLERRMQSSLDNRAKRMLNTLKNQLTTAAQRAGFRTRL